MNAKELADKLMESGTGRGKIDAALAMLGKAKKPQAVDLVRALHGMGLDSTVKKALDLSGIKDAPDFLNGHMAGEVKDLNVRCLTAERERDELKAKLAELEGSVLGPKPN